MSVTIHLHLTHRRHTNGQKTIPAEGHTIGEAISDLVNRYPGMHDELFDKKGNLLHYIEIYLNQASAYPGELEKKIIDGDDIQIVTFLAGG